MRGLRLFLTGMAVGLTVAAIDKELGKPPAQRTWEGTIAGIPYNFRVWEWRDSLRDLWNPASDQILTGKTLGLGWNINFAALTRRAQELLQPSTTTTIVNK